MLIFAMSRARLLPMRVLQVWMPACPRVLLESPRVPSCQESGTTKTRPLCVSSGRGRRVSMVVMRQVVLFRRLCRQLSRLLLQLLLKSADLGGWCTLYLSMQGKYLLNLGGSAF